MARLASAADLESSSDSDGFEPRAAPAGAGWGRRAARAVVVSAIGAVAVGTFAWSHSPSHALVRSAAAGSGVVGFSDEGAASAELAMKAADYVGKSEARNVSVIPFENKHDGNPCGDDEEIFEGICYSKCSELTGGKYGFRHSPWTCCLQEDCGPNPFKAFSCCVHHMGLCSGFDIAGTSEGKEICPHAPGVCLADEELFLDLCFAKCSLLTNGAYPHRTAASTCCKSSSGISCMVEDGAADGMDGQAITDPKLAVGGGCGDKTSATECQPHAPDAHLTES